MLGEGSVDGYHESCSFMVHVCQNPVISAHAMDLADITMKLPEVQATKVGAQYSPGTVNRTQNVLLQIDQFKVNKTSVITFGTFSIPSPSSILNLLLKQAKFISVPIPYNLTKVVWSHSQQHTVLTAYANLDISSRKVQ